MKLLLYPFTLPSNYFPLSKPPSNPFYQLPTLHSLSLHRKSSKGRTHRIIMLITYINNKKRWARSRTTLKLLSLDWNESQYFFKRKEKKSRAQLNVHNNSTRYLPRKSFWKALTILLFHSEVKLNLYHRHNKKKVEKIERRNEIC
jgi:hypothetical protein